MAVKLYYAVFMVDFVFMIVMVQTNPYYKGLSLARVWVNICVVLAGFLSYLVAMKMAKVIGA
jgi:hypothetical protein